MVGFMKGFEAQAYALMRVVVGFLFFWHGASKLFAFPMPPPPEAPAFVIWVAGTIELIGGLLVMIGFQARLAAFLCSGLMATAYWLAHGTKALLPIENQGEPAVIYCFVFLFISARGAGMWSVEGARDGA